MSPKELIIKAIELYNSARETQFYNPNIFRGRSSSISSAFEDLMAFFVALNNPKKCNYYTDQGMSFNDKIRYPDIVILEESKEIGHLIDLKTDLGWNREGLYEFCQGLEEIIKRIKNTNTKFKNGKTKEVIEAKFKDTIKYHVIVLCKKNSGKTIMEDIENVNKNLTDVKVYLLTEGEHLNEYKYTQNELLERIKIREDDFNKFMDSIINS